MLKRFFSILFTPILSLILSKDARRMIVVSSLYSALNKNVGVSRETIVKLNKALNLINGIEEPAAIKLPMVISSLIWDDVRIDFVKGTYELGYKEATLKSVVEWIPKFLRYGKGEKEDIEAVFKLSGLQAT